MASEDWRPLLYRLNRIEEEERGALGRGLHDTLGQSLTLLKLVLDGAAHAPAKEVSTALKEADALVDELSSRLRAMYLGMRPSVLEKGLLGVLLWHLDTYTGKTGVKVGFSHSGLAESLPLEVAFGAYGIIREALDNVAGHAKVSQAEVRVASDGRALSVRIEDKGCGFDPGSVAPEKSGGLRYMAEQAKVLDGTLQIRSAPGSGTTVMAELPLLA